MEDDPLIGMPEWAANAYRYSRPPLPPLLPAPCPLLPSLRPSPMSIGFLCSVLCFPMLGPMFPMLSLLGPMLDLKVSYARPMLGPMLGPLSVSLPLGLHRN